MGRPPTTEGRETRRRTLDAALDLFAARGFAGTTMREIARAVGVRESALYNHFPSKEAIFEALLSELGPGGALRLVESLDVESLVAKGPRAALREVAHKLVSLWAEPKELQFARIMLSDGARLSVRGSLQPEGVLLRARTLGTMLLSELVRRKLVRRVDPATAAAAFMGPLIAMRVVYMVLSTDSPDMKSIHKEVDAHVDFLWEALKP